MNKKLVLCIAVIMLSVVACSLGSFNTQTVTGSGKAASENRSVSGFTAIELKGSADVAITFGTAELVVIQTDDNILPLIETTVSSGRLLISTKFNTNIISSKPIKVNVTMKSLQGIILSGSGKITASGLVGKDLDIKLPGSGEITVTGTVENVNINLPGSGNIFCSGLKAPSSKATISGSGTIVVYASENLDASISGSGNIRYSGNPSQVKSNISGSGSITH